MRARTALLEVARAGEHRHLHFHDDSLFGLLCGVHDEHLARMEFVFGVTLVPRGNHLVLMGEDAAQESALQHIKKWYEQLCDGSIKDAEALAAALEKVSYAQSMEDNAPPHDKHAHARTKGQTHYMRMMEEKTVVFACGPAGSGKTYLAVAYGVTLLLRGEVKRLVLARPAVEAGERLGFLPGDAKDKIDPYLRPLYDSLRELLTKEQWQRALARDAIEVAPLAFMRGRTLHRSFIILDEAQNATSAQLRMCLTRLGTNSRMVVTADPSQIDLPQPQQSGIKEAEAILQSVPMLSFVHLTTCDVVRHPAVRAITAAYHHADKRRAKQS